MPLADRGAERLRHAKAVAHGGAAVARQQLLRRRRDADAAQHVEIGLEAAVGDHDARRAAISSRRLRLVSTAISMPPGIELQRAGAVPRRMRPWRLRKFASSRCSAMSRAVVLPGQAVALAPRRRQHVGAGSRRDRTSSMPSLLSHCISRRPSLATARARSLRAKPSVAASILADQRVLRRVQVGEVDVERAVGVARVADVFVLGALLQHDDALAELRGAVGGDEAGNAGADDDDVVVARPWSQLENLARRLVQVLDLAVRRRSGNCRTR